MEGTYDIFRGEEKIGKAKVRREGLYYHFWCNCRLTGQVIYRVHVTCGGKTESLGIPVPNGGTFCLEARLPVSRFQMGTPKFYAAPKHPPLKGKWVPISPETPFAYIEKLRNSVMERRNGQMGIFIPEMSDPIPQDNDPNPVCFDG